MDTATSSPVALAARGVTRRYGRLVALEPTDLDLHGGEVVVLLGPNGAGKSTLLALLAGALPATDGEVTTALPATTIGWAPQRPAQYRRLSARENLTLFARLLELENADEAARAMLGELELPHDDRPSAHLSVGNQQRLNLAIAFLGTPRALLLDEPTASLDPEQAHALWERVARARSGGAAVAVATHHLDEAVAADRVLTLREGRIVAEAAGGGRH